MSVVGQTVVDIAQQVRDGKVTPREVVEEHFEQIDRLDPKLGAFQIVRREKAVAEADELERSRFFRDLPLAGVPIPIKDNIQVAGEPMRDGTTATPDTPSFEDHEVTRRLRNAGAIVIGITRLPELGIFAATEGSFGVTRNPWNLDRTPGGSSGGAAAAVSSAMVPAAHGNDGLGSIRIPSACCGLFGIKPGRGVVPGPVGPTSWFGLAENGPIATTVADAALLLSVMSGRDSLRDPQPPTDPLRIAVSTKPPLAGMRVDRHFKRAVQETASLLERQGHRVTRADPPYSFRTGNHVLSWWFAAVDSEIREMGLDPKKLERRTRVHASLGRKVKALKLMKESQRERWRAQVAEFFTRFDLLVTPALARTPIAAEGWSERGWFASMWSNANYAPFEAAWNFAGYPGAAVPAGMHPDGLPLSVQMVAAEGQEFRILQVAKQLEELRPWPRHAPISGV